MDFFPVAAFIFSAICLFYTFHRRSASRNLPPGPYPLPVIGNLLQLGQFPHRSLAKLSKTYGPVFSLRFGRVNSVVVSSSAVVKQVLVKHDLAFSGRNLTVACTAHDHHKFSMGFLPIGPQWQKLRKIYQEHLFSVSRLEANQSLRWEKLQKLRDYVEKCCDEGRTANLCEAATVTTLNLVSATVFSMELTTFESRSAGEFMENFQGWLSCLATPNLADFFPVLKWFDPQGVRKKTNFYVGKLLGMTEDLIKERMKSRESTNYETKSDLLDALLDLMNETNYGLNINHIAHQVLDLLVAGSETTAGTIEWAMTGLLSNPEKLLKLQNELDTVIEPGKDVQESDIKRLPYLNAVVKEVFRHYPAGAIIFPHMAVEDVKLNGLFVPKGTQLLINAWAIGRDPDRWSNPDSFEPERFLDNKVDFKGQDFDLIPFGSGRRICPGMPLAYRLVYMAIATLVHNYDWKLGEVEVAEKSGLLLRRASPLKAIPIARNKRTSLVA